MDPIPRKQNLPGLVISRLRDGIARGEWEGSLPAERPLSAALQVSRSTLRLAIAQLKRDGWLKVVGKRTVITRRRRRESPDGAMRTRRVVFLSPLELEQLPSPAIIAYGELGRQLAAVRATIQLHACPALSHRKVDGYLEGLVRKMGAAGWVLHRVPLAVQRYFQSRSVPAVLFGNAHRGIDLPALRIDHHAALHHCLGSLDRLGHERSRVILVIPETDLAGNLELESAFLGAEGVCSRDQILRHGELDGSVEALLERALRRRPSPTSIVVLRTSVAARAHGLLNHRFGLSMPHDVSLACLEDAPFMSHLVPTVARYHIDGNQLAQFVFSELGRQLSSGIVKNWEHRPIVPEFVPGETLGKASEPR